MTIGIHVPLVHYSNTVEPRQGRRGRLKINYSPKTRSTLSGERSNSRGSERSYSILSHNNTLG